MAKNTQNDQKEMYSAVFNLHSALREAYWSTPDETTGDKITALADACYHILSELTKDDIKKRTAEYTDLKQLVETTNVRLKQIKKDIDQIINSVKVATKVVDGIEQVLELAAKFFV
jgi:hypothetical protein